MTEKDLQSNVLELARLRAWRAYHTYDSRRSQKGFPDLVLLKPPRLIFAELKVGKKRPTAEQRAWLDELDECPEVEAYLWYESDWHSGEIDALLKGPVYQPLGKEAQAKWDQAIADAFNAHLHSVPRTAR